MSAPVIHPENLLEKFAEGALTPHEHELLQEHLADCVACRFELVVRADLETEAETLEFDHISTRQLLLTLPPSQLTAAQPAAGLIAAGPLATGQLGPPEGELNAITPIAVRRRPWRRTLAITAAALGLASGAAALVATQAPSTPHALEVSARPADPVGQAAVRQRAPKSPRPADPEAQAPGAADAALAAPGKARASEPARQRGATPASRAATSSAEADETLTAAQLFSEANQARRASDAARATALYRLLQRKYPSS
ncbi:MAG TPA: zf-HC2 domain-containing protein, partial [Polyangiaceae bacterium]|nr:zf-HC2 domain-containing protein [Polyangiaceae bacterium]